VKPLASRWRNARPKTASVCIVITRIAEATGQIGADWDTPENTCCDAA
jgi:hypothetical protein